MTGLLDQGAAAIAPLAMMQQVEAALG